MKPAQIQQNGPTIAAQIAPLLPAIYAAATNPAHWPEAFAPITPLLGGNCGLIFSNQATPEQQGIWVPCRLTYEDFRPYVERYHAFDVWMQRGHELGLFVPGNVVSSDDLLPREEFLASVFYREFLAHADIHDLCCGILHDGSEPDIPIVHISIYRSHAMPVFGSDEKALLAALIPHLREATRIGFRNGALERQAGMMRCAVDTLSPLLLLDKQGKVVFANEQAQDFLEFNDTLKVIDGRLVVASGEQARLDALLGDRRTEETLLGITRPSDKGNLWLIRVPMPLEGNAPPDARRPAIALMIHDATAIDQIDLEGFAKVHDLSRAEARIMSLLLEHTSLPPIAQALNVTLHTVRSQLRAIREKTGAHRQAELIRMLMSWPKRMG
ncbi:MAG: helix-turn-helix transcriptional regulator [Gallionella sp.]|nr:helix-turn-helix transcriptional regulator [Gallionella sp.]